MSTEKTQEALTEEYLGKILDGAKPEELEANPASDPGADDDANPDEPVKAAEDEGAGEADPDPEPEEKPKSVEDRFAETQKALEALQEEHKLLNKRFGHLRNKRVGEVGEEAKRLIAELQAEVANLKRQREEEVLDENRPSAYDDEFAAGVDHHLKKKALREGKPSEAQGDAPAAKPKGEQPAKERELTEDDLEWGRIVLAEDAEYLTKVKDAEFSAEMAKVAKANPQDYQDDPYFVASESKRIWKEISRKREAASQEAAKKEKNLSGQDLPRSAGKGPRSEPKRSVEKAIEELILMDPKKRKSLDLDRLDELMGVA